MDHSRRSSSSSSSSSLTVAASLFCVSAYWFLQNKRNEARDSSKTRRKSRRFLVENGDSNNNIHDDSNERGAPVVGPRGYSAVDQPAVPYLGQFLTCLENQCDPVHNPMGYIPLCIAENRLVLDMLTTRFLQMTAAHNNNNSSPFADPRTYCYNSFLGMPIARDAAAYFIARRLLFADNTGRHDIVVNAEEALEAVQPQHVVLATGAAALLHHLFVLLGDEHANECCLIPTPYYAAFDNHCRLVANVTPFGIAQTNPTLGPTEHDLNASYRQARQKGLTPRFLLITNPNNPLGVIYTPAVMLRLVTWARQHDLHVIVDEVYALSTHHSHHHFESVIKVLNNQLGNDVHLLYALSKDFGASGLRVGMLYTQNEVLLEALPSVNIFTCVPGPIQYLVAELLTDDAFVTAFVETSRNRLAYSYQICVSKLEEMVIPYVPAEAGVFVYVDFSSLLPKSPTATDASRLEWETKLANLIFEYARVVLTPGSVQHDPHPGMFRICYGWVSIDVLQIAMERLSRLVAKIRRMDWDDLNERSLAGVLDVVVL